MSLAQGYPSAVDAINTKDMYSRLILFFNYGWWLVAGLIGNTTNSAQCWWLVAGLIGNRTNSVQYRWLVAELIGNRL